MSRLSEQEATLIAAAKGRRLVSNDTLLVDARRYRAAVLSDLLGFGALKRRFDVWRLTQQTRRELSRLSDYELRDIGLVRGQIDEVAESLSGVANDEPKLGLVESFKRWRDRRRTEDALSRLDAHLLRDIGVEPATVRHPANVTEAEILGRSAA